MVNTTVITVACDTLVQWDCELPVLFKHIEHQRFMKQIVIPLMFATPYLIGVIFIMFRAKPTGHVLYYTVSDNGLSRVVDLRNIGVSVAKTFCIQHYSLDDIRQLYALELDVCVDRITLKLKR